MPRPSDPRPAAREQSPANGRRSAGEGTITQRKDGYWQASLQVNGTRKYVYGKTRPEVAEKLRTLSDQARKSGGRLPANSKLTLAEFVDSWLTQAEARLRPATMADYRNIARLHVCPQLGSTTLGRLQPLRLTQHYATLSKTLSPRRVQMVHRFLHKALADAARWGLVASNVAALVEAPKPEPKEKTMWQPAHIRAFLAGMQEALGGQYADLFTFLLASGCREGEAFGLTWADVDWAAATVRIERQITWVRNRPLELSPKSRAGKRTIALPEWGVAALKRQRAQIAEYRLAAGGEWAGADHVFTTESGTPPSPTNLRRSLHLACDRLGLPAVRIHDLRHLHLSLLAMGGVPVKVAQQRAGHSSAILTLQVYQHVLGDAGRVALDGLAKVLEA